MKKYRLHRRSFLTAATAASLAPTFSSAASEPILKTIPSSGEKIPPIGMGSWLTFDVGDDRRATRQRTEVLRAFFAGGGKLINLAELRLVAIVQEQLMSRTAELQAKRDTDVKLSPEQKAEYTELQTQQAELADWIFRLSEPAEGDPEDRPEDFLPMDKEGNKEPLDPESIDELLPSLFEEE